MKTLVAGALVLAALAGSAQGAMVWSGLDLEFSKPDYADWTQPENQDRITDNVWITRQNSQGLFNIVLEDYMSDWTASPLDTEWAFSGIGSNVNPVFGAGEGTTMLGDLFFEGWVPSLDYWVGDNIVDRPGVLHLITDDIYIDILFTSWTGQGAGGGFTYLRGVPAPSSLALLGLGGLALRRRR
ncbi:MAG: PEP-CTERM sorting domain-containing protein [Phycisphaerales bacterium JB038]